MNPPTIAVAWSGKEKRQAIAVALSPLLVVTFIALGCAAITRINPFWPAFIALPFAYLTLFFGVMPALILLRRWHWENRFTFCLATYVGTVLPWFLVCLAFAPHKLHANLGTYSDILAMLSIPGVTAALLALLCWQWLFRAAAPDR